VYISDSRGTLTISIKNKDHLVKFRQEKGIADFFFCDICGVMTNVVYEEEGCLYCSININSTKQCTEFGNSTTIQVSNLSDEEKIQRWKGIWFSHVVIKY